MIISIEVNQNNIKYFRFRLFESVKMISKRGDRSQPDAHKMLVIDFSNGPNAVWQTGAITARITSNGNVSIVNVSYHQGSRASAEQESSDSHAEGNLLMGKQTNGPDCGKGWGMELITFAFWGILWFLAINGATSRVVFSRCHSANRTISNNHPGTGWTHRQSVCISFWQTI